jgi:hypothetical protein
LVASGIGDSLAASPLPHHRTYGSLPGNRDARGLASLVSPTAIVNPKEICAGGKRRYKDPHRARSCELPVPGSNPTTPPTANANHSEIEALGHLMAYPIWLGARHLALDLMHPTGP